MRGNPGEAEHLAHGSLDALRDVCGRRRLEVRDDSPIVLANAREIDEDPVRVRS